MTKQHKKDTIPGKDASREELARFWDSRSIADYQDELKPVTVHFAKNLSDALNIRFDPEDVSKIRAVAHKKGIGPTTLVRMWVREHLQA